MGVTPSGSESWALQKMHCDFRKVTGVKLDKG